MPQSLNAGKDNVAIGGKGLTDERRPLDLLRHSRYHLGKERQRDEARFESLFQRGVLKLGAFHLLVGFQPHVERRDRSGIPGAQQDLREQLVRVEGDWREQFIDTPRRLPRLRGRANPVGGRSTCDHERQHRDEHTSHVSFAEQGACPKRLTRPKTASDSSDKRSATTLFQDRSTEGEPPPTGRSRSARRKFDSNRVLEPEELDSRSVRAHRSGRTS